MGLFFSNLHICKTAAFSTDGFLSLLTETMKTQGFRPVEDPEEADLSVSIYDAGGKWLSVCSDGLDFYTEESIQGICNPISERLSADILTVSCFDSDCLLLNRINRKQDIDAWAKVGSCPEIKRRSTPARWKGLVDDLAQWKAVLRHKYTFAEEALESLEPLLGLAPGQGQFCDELIPEDTEGARTFHYALPESASKPEPPRLAMPDYGLTPCEMGKPTFASAVNRGGKSKGLAIAFSGAYVEHEEIRFRDVQLEYGFDRHPRPTIPLQLEKRRTRDGQWIYYGEIPDFQLREGVKEGIPPRRAAEEEWKREFGVRFTPEGNERKRLDIAVHFIPLKNPAGQCSWCVWWYSKSKRDYIKQHNRTWGNMCHPHGLPHGVKLLDADDFDMDE